MAYEWYKWRNCSSFTAKIGKESFKWNRNVQSYWYNTWLQAVLCSFSYVLFFSISPNFVHTIPLICFRRVTIRIAKLCPKWEAFFCPLAHLFVFFCPLAALIAPIVWPFSFAFPGSFPHFRTLSHPQSAASTPPTWHHQPCESKTTPPTAITHPTEHPNIHLALHSALAPLKWVFIGYIRKPLVEF